MLILSLTSFTTKQAEQHSKIQSILQFRAIWHILALVNKFSLYPLHGKAINGKAQIFETLRLWRPLEQREYATSRVLTPEHSYLQNSSNNICIFSSSFNFKLAKKRSVLAEISSSTHYVAFNKPGQILSIMIRVQTYLMQFFARKSKMLVVISKN